MKRSEERGRGTMDANLLRRVRLLAQGPTGSRHAIARLLMSEGSGLGGLTMGEVAQLSYTSKPSLVRFAQELGFTGWRAFADAFVGAALAHEERSLTGHSVDPNFPFDEDTPIGRLATSIAHLEGHARGCVLDALDEDALTEAGRRMTGARQLVYFGVAQNRFFGQNLSYRLRQIGMDCLVPEQHDADLVAHGMGPGHCAVLVSYSGSGEHRAPAVFLPCLTRRGVPCVVVTNSGDNYLRHHCDCCLTFPPEEHLYSKIAGYYSETATSFLLDLLFSMCFRQHYAENAQRKLDAVIANERRMQATDILPE